MCCIVFSPDTNCVAQKLRLAKRFFLLYDIFYMENPAVSTLILIITIRYPHKSLFAEEQDKCAFGIKRQIFFYKETYTQEEYDWRMLDAWRPGVIAEHHYVLTSVKTKFHASQIPGQWKTYAKV